MATYRLAVKDQVLLIVYNLSGPPVAYQKFYRVLQQLGPSWRGLPNVSLISTVLDSLEAWEALSPHLREGDRLLVSALSGDWAANGFDEAAIDWLKAHLTRSQSGSGLPEKPVKSGRIMDRP